MNIKGVEKEINGRASCVDESQYIAEPTQMRAKIMLRLWQTSAFSFCQNSFSQVSYILCNKFSIISTMLNVNLSSHLTLLKRVEKSRLTKGVSHEY